jgi:hypothetical protein
MSLASSPAERPEAPLFTDGLGQRVIVPDPATGELLQVLRLRPALTAVPSFEFALRERTARLANFRHAYYARVRRVDRVQANGSLAIVSDHVEGTRLSEILRVAHARGLQLDTNAALCFIRQLVPAVALLHENARDASHGLIAPERIVVTPHARIVLVEHVAGSALEQLQFGRERLWQEFRVAMPSSAGLARFDHRADVNGIGITALSLVLGRPLAPDEFPHAVPSLLMQARERSVYGEERPLSNLFRNWLARTLQLDVRRAFASASEALAALDETLASDSSYVAAPVALEAFLSQYAAAVLEKASPVQTEAVTPKAVFAPPPAAVLHPSAVPAAGAPAPPAPPASVPAQAPAPGAGLTPARATEPAVQTVPAPPAPRALSGSIEALPTLADLISVKDLGGVHPAPRTAAPAAVEPAVRQAPEPAGTPEPRASTDIAEPPPASRYEGMDEVMPRGAAGDPAIPDEDGQPALAAPERKRSRRMPLVAAVAVLLLGGGGVGAWFYTSREASPELGTLAVQSSPAGVEVFVDGVSRGMTPARISLPAGSHILELRGRGVPRVIPLQVPAGGQVSQYLEFADTPMTGMLVVHSQPAGAKVSVDGVARGAAPITLEGLSPGDHEVVLQNETGSSRHVVKVLAGTTASLVAPVIGPATEGPVSGWLSVKAPFTIEIHEDGQLLGTTETDRLMLAAGRHVLQFVNEPLGYRESRVVQVPAGKTAALEIALPNGTVNLNAAPWAEVWIDGKRVGDTPIGNLAVPIGPHEIVFRHPQLGEKRHAVSVTTAAPVRLSVDMK